MSHGRVRVCPILAIEAEYVRITREDSRTVPLQNGRINPTTGIASHSAVAGYIDGHLPRRARRFKTGMRVEEIACAYIG
ncbi:MAG: hypothetical protein IID38_01190 [Planctomycetes bacterium]|nr:hypothetical protein [Planctomycetota bacterium]MCH7884039.1 hypothetical protein [Planctomycetota bacterium]MCH7993470.1 hypothetical protein [Planctomycetota bacterium]